MIDHFSIKSERFNLRQVYLQNFNINQVQSFIRSYFDFDPECERLIKELDQTNILEKLPTTPMTLTLISLLYEDKKYEIPATITDLYKDFVDILLGKLEIKSKSQILDLEIKKRIYSHVSLWMLKNKKYEIERVGMMRLISDYCQERGILLDKKEDIERLLNSSGLFYLNDENSVGFKHISFLEYFVAFDIYNINQNLVDEMIGNFNDVNWQNSAVFYAGFTKDASWFVDKIINNVPFVDFRDWIMTIGGTGYVSQALYMTKVSIRAKLIEKAINS